MLAWEERRIRREVRATANRLANFDDANLRRSARAAVAAGARVQRALEILAEEVPEHLAAAGRLRMEHKQASLEELGALADPPLTKDAIAGRIRRLLAMADKRAQDLGIPDTEAASPPTCSPPDRRVRDLVNLDAAAASFSETWQPHLVTAVNDHDVKIARIHGEFVWHTHPDSDEMFLVVSGLMTLELAATARSATRTRRRLHRPGGRRALPVGRRGDGDRHGREARHGQHRRRRGRPDRRQGARARVLTTSARGNVGYRDVRRDGRHSGVRAPR